MQISVFHRATHIELKAQARAVAGPNVPPLFELTTGTPSVPQAQAFTLIDTLAVFMREAPLRQALVEVISPNRNQWLLEHIDIWNYAIEKGMKGTKIAYVVTARTVDNELMFAESYARKHGIMLKFFTARNDALLWLETQQFPLAPRPGTRVAAMATAG